MRLEPLTAPATDPRARCSSDHMHASLALQQLLRPSKQAEGGTLSTLWNMRDNVKYIQNLMAWILDLVESAKHIFTWAIPSKVRGG
jgi:hypothetical protein